MSFLRGAVKSLGAFFIIEFFIIVMALVIIGPSNAAGVNTPLPLIEAAADSIDVTVGDLAVGMVVLMTFVNFIILFIANIRR